MELYNTFSIVIVLFIPIFVCFKNARGVGIANYTGTQAARSFGQGHIWEIIIKFHCHLPYICNSLSQSPAAFLCLIPLLTVSM